MELARIKMNRAVIMKQSEYIVQIGKQDFRKEISFSDFQSLWAKYTYAEFSMVPKFLTFMAVLAQITEEKSSLDQPRILKLPKGTTHFITFTAGDKWTKT